MFSIFFNEEVAEAEEAALSRRTERIKEISDLLVKEKALILELSTSLGELQTVAKTAVTTNKSSKRHASTPVDEGRLVDLNLQFLLACEYSSTYSSSIALIY